MKWVNNVPLWVWFAFTMVLVYLTWNPTGYSLYEYMFFNITDTWSSRAGVAIILVILYGLLLNETKQTFSVGGAVIFTVFIGIVVWKVIDLGLLSVTNFAAWQWLTPAVLGLLLFLGFQGGRIYRSLTGRMPVSVDHHAGPDTDHHHQN